MNDSEMRIAIAEALGWKWYRRPATGPWAAKPMRSLYHPLIAPETVAGLRQADMTERECNPVFIWREGLIPDYLNDLNAMNQAEAELMCNKRNVFIPYCRELERVCEDVESAHVATARQRAEAFLKTVDKWKEEVAA